MAPVMLARENWSTWLGDTNASPDQLQELFKPFPATRMRAWPVTARVGNVKNDDAELVQPLTELVGELPGI
jgi:putative SOS response-associated peptidase YedK